MSGNPLSFSTAPTYVTGKFGQAASAFRASIPSAVFGTSPVNGTLEGWFNVPAGSTGYEFFAGRESGGSLDWVVGFNGSTIVVYGAGTFYSGPATYVDGKWHHWALTVTNNGTATLWVDGAQAVATPSGVASLAGYHADLIDLGYGNNVSFGGALDDILPSSGIKYTAAFTPPTSAFTGSETNALALYHLDGNGNDSLGSSGTTPATAYTLTGPSSATAGTASSNFAVTLNGTLSAATVITPTDGASGTFTPPTLSIAAGQTTGTFTYTPASAGSRTVSATNNQSLTNPSGVAVTVSAASSSTLVVAANDPSLAKSWSPYNFHWDGTSFNTNNPGAYEKFTFSGTQLGLNLVASVGVATLAWSIDNGPLQTNSLQASSLTLASGLASGSHTLELYLMTSDNNANRWSLATALRIKSFILDAGATITAPTLRSKLAIWFGDSISVGFRAGLNQASDALLSEVHAVCQSLDAEYGLVAFEGQGFTTAGSGDVPTLASSYSSYSSGVSRLVNGVLSPAPDYLFCMQGANGGGAQSDVAAQIANFRTIAPSATIFMVVEPGGFIRAAVTAAVQAAVQNGDTNIFIVDGGSTVDKGLGQFGTASRQSSDGLHPLGQRNILIASVHSALVQQAVRPHRFSLTLS